MKQMKRAFGQNEGLFQCYITWF